MSENNNRIPGQPGEDQLPAQNTPAEQSPEEILAQVNLDEMGFPSDLIDNLLSDLESDAAPATPEAAEKQEEQVTARRNRPGLRKQRPNPCPLRQSSPRQTGKRLWISRHSRRKRPRKTMQQSRRLWMRSPKKRLPVQRRKTARLKKMRMSLRGNRLKAYLPNRQRKRWQRRQNRQRNQRSLRSRKKRWQYLMQAQIQLRA